MNDGRQYLSEEVRIFDEKCGIRKYHPIQAETFRRGRETDSDIVVSASTNGGKSIAAFDTACSMSDFGAPGVRILYISPRKALNKDKIEYLEALSEHLGTTVTLWDGDARQGPKNRLVRDPKGILVTTTESLQGMFTNHPDRLERLFGCLSFVIVDEIHCFVGTAQGVQLGALLNWITDIQEKPFRLIGLSATIGGDGSAVKGFLGRPEKTVIVKDPAVRPMEAYFEFYPEDEDSRDLPEDVIDSICTLSAERKNLVFANSRSRVEELASRVRERLGGAVPCHAHHSSLSRETRERVEYAARNDHGGMAIICTSTLEPGIDIGDIHSIIQVGPPPGTASLMQRAGRSGRRDGTARIVFICTRAEDLLQTLAAYNLCRQGRIEAPDTKAVWYSVIPQQILSLVKQGADTTVEGIVSRVTSNAALSFASADVVRSVIGAMIEKEALEVFEGELILGPEGERRVRRMDFYAAFNTERTCTVMHDGKVIGCPPLDSGKDARVGDVILLDGHSWEVTGIDREGRAVPVLHVRPSTGGKKPTFISDAPMVGRDVESEMLRILLSDERYDVLGGAAAEVIDELRETFRLYDTVGAGRIPCFTDNANRFCFFPFCGTRVSNTLKLLLRAQSDGRLLSGSCSRDEFIGRCKGILEKTPDIVGILEEMIGKGEIAVTGKNQDLLPLHCQAEMESANKYDLEGALQFLRSLVDGSSVPSIPYESWAHEGPPGGCGACSTSPDAESARLEGRIYLHVVFASERQYPARERERQLGILREAADWLAEQAATYGKDVSFIIGPDGETVSMPILRGFDSPASERTRAEDVLSRTEVRTPNGVGALAVRNGCDRYALVVMTNAYGRSFADSHHCSTYLGSTVLLYNEGSIHDIPSGVVAHEIAHLGGAEDLYADKGRPDNPASAKVRAGWPRDIMVDSQGRASDRTVSPFTAWKLGWTEEKEDWYDDYCGPGGE